MSELPPNIHPIASGFRVVACIGRGPGLRREKRFPHGTAPRTMVKWQEDTRTALRKARPVVAPGSVLENLVDVYLPAVAMMPTKATRERHLREWFQAIGPKRDRNTVAGPEIKAILERWRKAGMSKAYSNRYRTALMHFYTVMNGKSGTNPVRDVEKQRERKRPPRQIDYATFERIIQAMTERGSDAKTLARLRVIAYTGLPHRQVMQLKAEHIRWAERAIYVPGRDKGDGTDDRILPLSKAGIAALSTFADAGAWGDFAQPAMRNLFRAAAAAIGRSDLNPYDLRHLFGTTVLACSKNRAATRDLMLHTTDLTTARYVAGAIPVELRDAIDAFDAVVVAPGCGQPSPTSEDAVRSGSPA